MSSSESSTKRRAVHEERKVVVPVDRLQRLPHELVAKALSFADVRDLARLAGVAGTLQDEVERARSRMTQTSVTAGDDVVKVVEQLGKLPALTELKLNIDANVDLGLEANVVRLRRQLGGRVNEENMTSHRKGTSAGGLLEALEPLRQRLLVLDITSCSVNDAMQLVCGCARLERLSLRFNRKSYAATYVSVNLTEVINTLRIPTLRELEVPVERITEPLDAHQAAWQPFVSKLKAVRSNSAIPTRLSVALLRCLPECEIFDLCAKADVKDAQDHYRLSMDSQFERVQLDSKTQELVGTPLKLRTLTFGDYKTTRETKAPFPPLPPLQWRKWLRLCPQWRMEHDTVARFELQFDLALDWKSGDACEAAAADAAAVLSEWWPRVGALAYAESSRIVIALYNVQRPEVVIRPLLRQRLEYKDAPKGRVSIEFFDAAWRGGLTSDNMSAAAAVLERMTRDELDSQSVGMLPTLAFQGGGQEQLNKAVRALQR